MAKRHKSKKVEEEKENGEPEEKSQGKQAAKKRKAPVKAAAKEPRAIRKTDERPLSVGGIIIRSRAEHAAWEKDAPWHRKNPSESRFRDHGTDRRTKD